MIIQAPLGKITLEACHCQNPDPLPRNEDSKQMIGKNHFPVWVWKVMLRFGFMDSLLPPTPSLAQLLASPLLLRHPCLETGGCIFRNRGIIVSKSIDCIRNSLPILLLYRMCVRLFVYLFVTLLTSVSKSIVLSIIYAWLWQALVLQDLLYVLLNPWGSPSGTGCKVLAYDNR